MTTPPNPPTADCRCADCGLCYHDHAGWKHPWQAKVDDHPSSMTTPQQDVWPKEVVWPDESQNIPWSMVLAVASVRASTVSLPPEPDLEPDAPILVDTETAAFAAGRTETVIYRWGCEGRLTRHGSLGKGNARWNLREIPAWDGPDSGTPRPAPPRVKPQNFQDMA